jgi:predicted ATPase
MPPDPALESGLPRPAAQLEPWPQRMHPALVSRVVVTGGPGVGKTTVLRELAARGYAVIEESAREIIRERRANGQSPRPEPREFAAELLRRDRAKYSQPAAGDRPVFFDRCLVESVAMAQEAGLLAEPEATAMLSGVKFHPRVFILPPWRQIYINDAERDHTFEHCQRVHEGLVRWYLACGYRLHEVPCTSPSQRAGHVLRALAEGGA